MKILSLILLFPVLLPVCAGCVSEKAPVQGKQENPYRSVFEKGDYIGFQFLCEDKQPYPEIFTTLPPPMMCRKILEEKSRDANEVELLTSLAVLSTNDNTRLRLLNGTPFHDLPEPTRTWLIRDVIAGGSTNVLKKLIEREKIDLDGGFFQRSCAMKQTVKAVYWRNGIRKTADLPKEDICLSGIYHSHGLVHDAIGMKNPAAAELLIRMGAPYRDSEKKKLETMRARPLEFLPAINTLARLENQLNAGLKPDDPRIEINFEHRPPLRVLAGFMNASWQSRVSFYPQIHYLIKHGATDGIDGLEKIAIGNCDMDLLLCLEQPYREHIWRKGILTPYVKRMIAEKRDLNRSGFGFQGCSTILSECAACNHVEAVRLLLEAGADPDKSYPEGKHPLTASMRQGNIEIVKLLLDKGVTIQPEDIITAGYSGSVELVRFLAERGSDMHVVSRWTHGDETGESDLLQSAVCSGNLDLVRFLVEKLQFKADRKWKDVHCSLLYNACSKKGSLALFRYLLSIGAPFNSKSKDMIVLMDSAAQWGHADLICFLASSGVSVNDVSSGNTPLHWAAAQGHEQAVRVLLELGADKKIRNHLNLTPEEFALRFPDTERTRKLLCRNEVDKKPQVRIEVSAGINMNNGCGYVRKIILLNAKQINVEFKETKGRYYALHRKYQLEQWRTKGSHQVSLECFMTDWTGNVLSDSPKAVCFSPALRLYDLLEKYCPTPEQARRMWLGVLEFHNDNAKIESYLTEQEIMLSRIPRQGEGKK